MYLCGVLDRWGQDAHGAHYDFFDVLVLIFLDRGPPKFAPKIHPTKSTVDTKMDSIWNSAFDIAFGG